ncbi:MAG: hypothetical protein ACLR6J_14155 [Parabacteroides merdae]
MMRFQEVQADASFRNGKTVVTMVAGFRYQKDQDTLINKVFLAFCRLEQYELWLVGDGAMFYVEDLVSWLGILEMSVLGIRSDIPVL